MSNNFQDRIARLNAKAGAEGAVMMDQPVHAAPAGADDLQTEARQAKPSIAKHIAFGLLMLVVMPVGAAMATVYLGSSESGTIALSAFFNDVVASR